METNLISVEQSSLYSSPTVLKRIEVYTWLMKLQIPYIRDAHIWLLIVSNTAIG